MVISSYYDLRYLIFKSIINFFSSNLDKLIINHLLGVREVGILSVIRKMSDSFYALTNSLDNSYIPDLLRLASEQTKGWAKNAKVLLEKAFSFYVIIILSFVLFADEVAILLGKKDYGDLQIFFMLLFPFYMILFFGKQKQIIIKNKLHYVVIFYCLRLVLLTVSYMLILPEMGILGVALSMSLVEIIVGLYAQWVNQRLIPLHWPIKKIITLLILASIVILGVFFLNGMGISMIYTFIVKAVAMLVLSFLVFISFRKIGQ